MQQFAADFALDLQSKFTFRKNPAYTGKPAKMPFPVKEAISVEDALTRHVDLTGAVSKKTLNLMISLCESQDDKQL